MYSSYQVPCHRPVKPAKWFIMKFIGNESEININTKKPEFFDWKWIDLEDLTKIAVDFKLNVYKELKKEVLKVIN